MLAAALAAGPSPVVAVVEEEEAEVAVEEELGQAVLAARQATCLLALA